MAASTNGDPTADARARMVKEQIAARGVRDKRVLRAIGQVPRHGFVPERLYKRAYDDGPLGIGKGQTISQPYMVAMMTELLELKGDERVLEIGTGSGYQAAVLSLLAREVLTIERIAFLAGHASETLGALGYENIEVRIADGTLGWPGRAPYDAIIVTAGGPRVPETLIEQLVPGGRLVCPVGGRKTQKIVRIVRTPNGHLEEEGIQCAFVPLIGEKGW